MEAPANEDRSLLLLLFLARCGAVSFACFGQDHISCVCAITAILGGTAGHDHLVADLHEVSRPASCLKSMRRTHFESPIHDLSGLLVLYIDVEPDVRVRPIHFRDIPSLFDLLLAVKLGRKRVVSRCGCSAHQHTAHCQSRKCRSSHRESSCLLKPVSSSETMFPEYYRKMILESPVKSVGVPKYAASLKPPTFCGRPRKHRQPHSHASHSKIREVFRLLLSPR